MIRIIGKRMRWWKRSKSSIRALVTAMMLGLCGLAQAADYYIDADGGDDSNSGTSPDQAWATLAKASAGSYDPGDSILLQKGDRFEGKLFLNGESGAEGNPILIASYGDGDKPLIDAAGYLAGVQIQNSHYVEARDLEITADGGVTVDGSPRDLRYGVLVRAQNDGSTSNVTIRNMTIYEVYPEIDMEHEGKNPTTYLGTGIRLSGIQNTTSSHFIVEGCDIRRVGFKAIEMQRVSNLEILDNFMQHIGGPAIQPSRVDDLLVRGNTVDGSGDYSDTRMHGRGSGIWPWSSNRVLIEKNRFMHARGRYDSCGAHIDFNCNDVVVQYNLSWDNEGGFVEILGNNNNCAYRYNISIDDGARIAGVNGASGNGDLLWTSGFVGNGNPLNGPFNSYIYNNSIYVSKGQRVGFRFEATTGGLLIANNIFYIEGDTVDDTTGTWTQESIDRVVWENNLYQKTDLLPETLQIKDAGPMIGDPGFANEGGVTPEDYVAYFFENIKDKGIPIEKIPGDSVGLRIGLEVTEDFFGNPIVGLPDLGAVEAGDTRPPLPEVASFDEPPLEEALGQVAMKAIRTFEPVEYFFEEVSGNVGGSDSGWQTSRIYEDDSLLPNTRYRYRVSMRAGENHSLADSSTEDVLTNSVDPFEGVSLFSETFASSSYVGNRNAPFPVDSWHCDDGTSWQRDNSGTSVGIESSGAGPALRLGWGFDEVEIRRFASQPIDLNRGYGFSGNWRIKSILENSNGFIAGIGEFDSETGTLVRRLKEAVFGELENPQVDLEGNFEIRIDAQELVDLGADPTNFIGVYFHHDDDGNLFADTADGNARGDVYLASGLEFWQSSRDVDLDGDGMGDAFEEAYGLNPNDPSDGELDLDGDGLSNREEYVFGSDPTIASIRFVPPFETAIDGDRVLVPSASVEAGRVYILEKSTDLGQSDPWTAVDFVEPAANELSEDIVFEMIEVSASAFFRTRIEWSR